MEKSTFNLSLLGFILGLILQLTIIFIDGYATYGEFSFNVIKLQQKNPIFLFLDTFPFIFLFLGYLIEKKYNIYIDKFKGKIYTNIDETLKNKVKEKTDTKENKDELYKKILKLQKENSIKGKLLNESYINIKNKIDEITDLGESIDKVKLLKNLSNEINNQLVDMQDFIKLDNHEIKLSNKNMSISITIENLLDSIYIESEKKGIELFYYINLNTPDSIIIDATYLSKILEKLLIYSLNTTKKGYVFLSITAEKKINSNIEIKFLIENTSSGVEDNKLAWGDTPTDNSDHIISDLGLILCKKWSELLGSNLFLENKIGKGTSFFLTFELPTNKVNYKAKEDFSKLKDKNIVLLEEQNFTTNLFKLYFDRYNAHLKSIKSLEEEIDKNTDLLIVNKLFNESEFETFIKNLANNNFPILILCYGKNNDFINKIEKIDNFYGYKNNNLFFLAVEYIKEKALLSTILKICNSYVQETSSKSEKINTEKDLIDLNVISNLKEISDETNNLFNEIVSDFEQELPSLIENLKLASKNHDKKQSLELIKKIEGPSINLGLKELFKTCEKSQENIQKENFDEANKFILDIEKIYLLSLQKLKILLI